MKMLASLKGIAVKVLVILLALIFVSIATYNPRKMPDASALKIYRKLSWAHTINSEITDKMKCAVFGKGVVDGLKSDDKLRSAFFKELTDYITGRFNINVTGMEIQGDEEICIYTSPATKQENPSYKLLARLM